MMLYLLHIVFLFSMIGNDFDRSLKEYLEKQLSMYESFDYEIVQMPANYSKIEIIPGSPLNLNAAIVSVPVILAKGSNRKESFVKIRLHLYKSVVTVKNKIESKTDLDPSDFEIKKLDVSSVKGTPVCSLNDVNDFKTKIALTPGRVLIREILEPKPVILNGDLVKASLTNGSVTISMEVNARQDGAVGEIIRVVTQEKKQYKAKVIDSSNVNILE